MEGKFQKGMSLFGANWHNLMDPQCRKVHPWLSDDWLLKALTQQLLQDTSKKYKWEDWGEESLIKAINRRADKAQTMVRTFRHY
jgi:ribosomal protein L17